MILAPTLTLSAGSGAAIVRPTFSRDFAGEKTLNNGTGPAITFTRASAATYFDANGTLQTASNDVPRFDHDPATGASRGLLIEESRQNLFERSAEFDNAYWIKTSTTVTADNAVAPDGTTTADLTEKTGNDATTPARVVSVAASAYTLSAFFKNNTGGRARLRIDATGGTVVDAVFDIVAGTVVSASAGLTTSIVNAGNGWFRCAITYTFSGAVNATFGISARNTSADNTGAKAWIWGAQLEAGAFPTSYIPTTSAAVTRSADSAVVTPISGFYNQSEGTVVVEASYANAGSDTNNANRVLAQFDDETSNNRHWIVNRGTNGAGGNAVATGGVTQATTSIGSTAVAAGVVVKLGAALKENDVIAAKDGTLSAQDTSATMPLVTRLGIGRSTTTAANLQGHIRKVAYWPKRLSNTLLQQLTT